MAKKSETISVKLPPGSQVVEDENADEAAEELARLNEDEGGELFRVSDELRAVQGARFIITRTYPPGPDSAGYVGEMSPGEFSIERLRQLYGPGKYKIRCLGPKGLIPGGGSVTITKGVEPPKDSGGVGSISELLRVIEERSAREKADSAARRDKLLELTIPGALTVLAAVLGKNTGPDMTSLIAALKPAPPPSLNELAQTLASIKALQGEQKSELSGLEGLLKAMELMKDFGGGGDSKQSNWLDVLRDVVKEVVPAARPMIENLQAQAIARAQAANPAALPAPSAVPMPPAPPRALPPQIPPPAPGAAPTSEPTSAPGSDADMWAMAKPMIDAQVQKLIRWATEETSSQRPDLYAEVFLTELPQIVATYVKPTQALAYLQHPDWWQVVRTQYPELTPHYAWLDRFRAELVLLIEEQVAEREEHDSDHGGTPHDPP